MRPASPSFARCRWTLGVAILAIGCGGKSQATGAGGGGSGGAALPDAGIAGDAATSSDGGATSCDPRPNYTSLEAVQLAKCSSSLPSGTLLLSVVSNGAASLDSTGRDTLWQAVFWDLSDLELYSVTVNAFGSQVSHGPDQLSCGSSLDPLDSAVLVPDAVQRLGATTQVPLFMRQTLTCVSGDPAARDERYVATSTQGEYTFVLYDSTGAYLSTCPCSFQDPTKCGCIP
jgi:hypothetical protein